MCYHVSSKGTPNQLKEVFKAPYTNEDFHKIYYHANGFAHPLLPVFTKGEIRTMSWGLIPNWKTKTLPEMLKIAKGNLNARDNTIFEKVSFKNSIRKQRCIIPVTGIYEPHTYQGKKYPFYIGPKSGMFLLLAGIYSFWKDPVNGEWMSTFSIITTDPNRPFKKIHNEKDRMPVILEGRNINLWLDEHLPDDSISELMQPCVEDNLIAYSVSKDLFSPQIDSNKKYITDKVQYDELKYDDELYNGFNLN